MQPKLKQHLWWVYPLLGLLAGVAQGAYEREALPPGGHPVVPWGYQRGAYPVPQQPRVDPTPLQIFARTSTDKVQVNQALIYTVHINSAQQLVPFEPSLIPAAGWQGRPLQEGARAGSEMTPQGQRWRYEFDFVLVPLRVGQLSLPIAQASVQGVTAPGTVPLKLEISNPPTLQIQAKPNAISEAVWLPATKISIAAHFDPPLAQAEVGQSLVLWVTVGGEGVSSDQLPSLQGQLSRPSGYDLYLQAVQHADWRAENGALQSHNIERYQLIPRQPGSLTLPALQLHWFDLSNDKLRSSALPAANLRLDILPRSDASSLVAEAEALVPTLVPTWALLAGGLILLVSGWWIFWFSHHPDPFRWWYGATPTAAPRPAVRFVPAAHNPFMPHAAWVPVPAKPTQPHVPPARTVRFVPAAHNPFIPPTLATPAPKAYPLPSSGAARRTPVVLPRPVQSGVRGWWRRLRLPAFPLWECLHCIKTVDEPSTLCHLIQSFACKQFGTPLSMPLQQISVQLATAYPSLNQQRLQQLIGELDNATYGRSQLDIRQWKRAFRSLMWPTFFLRPRATTLPERRRRGRGRLPELNPRA